MVMFWNKNKQDYESLFNKHKNALEVISKNETLIRWYEFEIARKDETISRLNNIVKELEVKLVDEKESQLNNSVKSLESEKMKGDFPKKYWAYMKAHPGLKMSMSEFRDQVYKKDCEVVKNE